MARIKTPYFQDPPLSQDAEWLSRATLDGLVNKLRRLRVNVIAEERPHSPNRTSDVLCYHYTSRPAPLARPFKYKSQAARCK